MEKILVVDDSIPYLSDVELLLADHYKVLTASTGKKALEVLKTEQVDAVLLDLMLPDINGNEVLKIIRSDIDPLMPVLIVTDYSNAENAVTAMRNGAYDFFPKKFNKNILFEKIGKALQRRRLEVQVDALKDGFLDVHNEFIFCSEVMRKTHMEITRLAATGFDVLIEGETGVGKDLITYEIHKRSHRSGKQFIPLSMKAFSETLIESELFGHEKGAFSGADKAKSRKTGGGRWRNDLYSRGHEFE